MAEVLIRRLALAGAVLAVFVVVLGAFTRLVDAGLGCPDWPGCYGHLLWPNDAQEIQRADEAYPEMPVDLDKTWPEMVHRYFAGGLLLLVAGMVVVAFRQANLRPAVRTLCVSLLVLIICQAAFGAWTVTLKLWPQVVTAHLLGGFATWSLLWAIYLRTGGAPALTMDAAARAKLTGIARIALVVVVVQIALGGWVSSNYAALACADFPTCMGSMVPPQMDFAQGFNLFQDLGPNYLGGLLGSDARVAIHWTHRVGAVVVLLTLAVLLWRMWPLQRPLSIWVGSALALQLLLGTLNVVWALPLWIATAHNAVGALLLLSLVTVNFAPLRSEPGTQG